MKPKSNNDELVEYVFQQEEAGEPVVFMYETLNKGERRKKYYRYHLTDTGIMDMDSNYVYEYDRITAFGSPPPRPESQYVVYVLEVDDDPMTVYVGQTWHSREHRLQQHLEHGRLSAPSLKHATKLKLRPDLYEDIPPAKTQDESFEQEDELAERLKRLGYTVLGGH